MTTTTTPDLILITPEMQAILDAPLPALIDPKMRGKGRKERSAAIRALFKRLGLKGLSVTTPNYSMASTTNIRTPRLENPPTVLDDFGRSCWHSTYAENRNKVVRKIEQIILAAFPDLDNRSDSQSDYFDSCLLVD